MRLSLPISPKYDSPIFEAIAIQIFMAIVGALMIDPVGTAQVFGIALLAFWVKVAHTMKRIFTLIVLLGIVMGAVLTGCSRCDNTQKPSDTNAAPAAPAAPSTNK